MTTMFDLFGYIARRKTHISRLSRFRLLSAYLIFKQKTWISLTTKSALSKSQIIHVTANCLLNTKSQQWVTTQVRIYSYTLDTKECRSTRRTIVGICSSYKVCSKKERAIERGLEWDLERAWKVNYVADGQTDTDLYTLAPVRAENKYMYVKIDHSEERTNILM